MFLDESGFPLQPVRRRTWVPRGQTPIQYAWNRHDRFNAVAARTFSLKARRPGAFFRLLDHNLRMPDCLDFLTDLHRHVQRKIIVFRERLNVRAALPASSPNDIQTGSLSSGWHRMSPT